MVPDLLCRFTLDAHILAKYGEPPDGRVFEAALVDVAHVIGFPVIQGPGSLTLFGTPAVSKSRHEIDLAVLAPGMLGIAEAKDIKNGVGKNDVMVFIQKTFDYYLNRLSQGRRTSTWRFLVSSSPVGHDLSVYCIQQGVIVVDPTFIPIPSLLRFISKTEAEDVFNDMQLAEAVRLFEPACLPLDRVFVLQDNHLFVDLERFFGGEASEAQWLADQMSEDILAKADESGRDPLKERAEALRRCGRRGLYQSFPKAMAV